MGDDAYLVRPFGDDEVEDISCSQRTALRSFLAASKLSFSQRREEAAMLIHKSKLEAAFSKCE